MSLNASEAEGPLLHGRKVGCWFEFLPELAVLPISVSLLYSTVRQRLGFMCCTVRVSNPTPVVHGQGNPGPLACREPGSAQCLNICSNMQRCLLHCRQPHPLSAINVYLGACARILVATFQMQKQLLDRAMSAVYTSKLASL